MLNRFYWVAVFMFVSGLALSVPMASSYHGTAVACGVMGLIGGFLHMPWLTSERYAIAARELMDQHGAVDFDVEMEKIDDGE